MKLYFENSRGVRRLIAEPDTEKAALKAISAFCEERNFHIYYIRSFRQPDDLKCFDVGSHTEFFYLDDNSKED